MFSHMLVGTNDLEKAKTFYDAVFGAIGIGPGFVNEDRRIFYMSPGGAFGVTKPIDGQPASVGNGGTVQNTVKISLGVALLVAVAMMIFKAVLGVRRHVAQGGQKSDAPIQVHRVATVLIGAIGGLIVGMMSVDSGSLIIVALLLREKERA